jgi:hypothetical protein
MHKSFKATLNIMSNVVSPAGAHFLAVISKDSLGSSLAIIWGTKLDPQGTTSSYAAPLAGHPPAQSVGPLPVVILPQNRLIGPSSGKDSKRCFQHNLKIKPEALPLYVLDIHAHHLIKGRAAAPLHLP